MPAMEGRQYKVLCSALAVWVPRQKRGGGERGGGAWGVEEKEEGEKDRVNEVKEVQDGGEGEWGEEVEYTREGRREEAWCYILPDLCYILYSLGDLQYAQWLATQV